jgi:hypothetical protein
MTEFRFVLEKIEAIDGPRDKILTLIEELIEAVGKINKILDKVEHHVFSDEWYEYNRKRENYQRIQKTLELVESVL